MRDDAARATSGIDEVASVIERLGVILTAGVPPDAAWRYVAEADAGENSNLVQVVGDIDAGYPIGEAIIRSAGGSAASSGHARPRGTKGARTARSGTSDEASAWRGLAAAWIVATSAGAPLAPALQEFASSLRALAQVRRDAATALSGPVATAKLVTILPAIGVFFGMALGFDTLGTLFTTLPGLACVALGGALMWSAHRWNRRLVKNASPRDITPGLTLDLLAIGVSGGASIDRARRSVIDALERSELGVDLTDADGVLRLSERAGVPAGALLRSEAARRRREARSAADRKAATLAVTLMLPLGLCVLPAFMLLGVAPLMMTVLSSTVGEF